MSCPDWIGKRAVEASDVVPLVNQLCRNIGVEEIKVKVKDTEVDKIVKYYNDNIGQYFEKNNPQDLRKGESVWIGFPEGHDANFAAHLASQLWHYFPKDELK